MSRFFEELDFRPTPIGTLILRRRREHRLDIDVFEIKLGEAFLMSSLFTDSEVALARLGLDAARDAFGESPLAVVVGGLGLGYTAQAVLADRQVDRLLVVEMLEAVIDWHREGLLPLGRELVGDPRCRLVAGDFFALAGGRAGFDPDRPGARAHAILVDIDHSPDFLLDGGNAGFYTPEGLRRLAGHLHPGGVFGLWSDDPPDTGFADRLAEAFVQVEAQAIRFHNPLQDREVVQSVYLARTPRA